MNNPDFTGPFRKEMTDFIQLKRSIGYKYLTEAGILLRFDRFLSEKYPDNRDLTKEAVNGWCAKTPHEKSANQCSRASVVRQFAKHLDSIGRRAYILPNSFYPAGNRYVPHIYTPDELRRFFAETDKCRFCYECPARHLIMPIFFRLLFSCGLRCSEARLLKVGDVDLENGVLSIRESKNHNSRLVPMDPSMAQCMREYACAVHTFPDGDSYFFSAMEGRPMTIGNVYKNFRRFLWRAGISHTGDGPRVHDFRHGYAVYRLKEWSRQGKDLMAYLPILRTYMGHNTFYETAYYLRMTADVFPDICLKLEHAFGYIIPESAGGPDETY